MALTVEEASKLLHESLNNGVEDPLEALSDSKAISALESLALEYHCTLSHKQASDVLSHLRLLLKKNEIVNLTAIRDVEKGVYLHSLDSLLFIPVMDRIVRNEGLTASEVRSLQVLDMGTGGGFPGIPLACSSDCNYTLLDSVSKKIAACTEFIYQLALDERVEAVSARLEEYAAVAGNRDRFDFVVARAVAPLDILIEYATPLLKPYGYLVLSKGTPDKEELEAARHASKLCGLKNVSRETFELPEDYGHREFFVYQRIKESRVKLPRKNGEARKKPLANFKF